MAKNPTPPRLIKRPKLRALLGGISDDMLAELVADGRMPKPITFGPRTVMFPLDEVEHALAAMRAAR